jgi:probable rRNA maturation factor
LVILQKKVPALSRVSLERFVLRARRAAGVRGVADVLLTSSSAMRALNQQFRGKNKATDVLSFPAAPVFTGAGRKPYAGEIAVCADIAAENAARLGHSSAEEVKILTLHGLLHLAGFDHERDNGEMARKEMKLRQALGLPVALIERSESDRHGSVEKRSFEKRSLKKRSLKKRLAKNQARRSHATATRGRA